MQVTKPWGSGNGNVTLTFGGQGNGTITITSDINDLSVSRSMTLTVRTLDSSIVRTVTIVQATQGHTPNFILSDGKYLKLSNGDYFNVQENT